MIIKNDPDIIKSYLEDTSNITDGRAECVVVPESIEELSGFIKESNGRKMPVTISGGGTGTTGSRIPFGGAILSTENLSKIYGVSRPDMSASVETGVLVDALKDAADREGLFYACHPTEKSASVGGTIATNASGARSFKYGPTRNYVKRLRMVLANGEIFEIRRGERYITKDDCRISLPGGLKVRIPVGAYRMPDVKSSAGYFIKDGMDLIDLFIGQEGTLSIITDAEIGFVRKPEKILSAFVFFKNEEDAISFAADARSRIEALSIEFFDAGCVRLIDEKTGGVPAGAGGAIFFEQETTAENESAMLEGWLSLITKYKVSLDDTWVAMNEKDAEKFLDLRHCIPEAMNDMIRKGGHRKISTDMAVPEESFREMVKFYIDGLEATGVENYIFGHIGEYHLHVNLLPRSSVDLEKSKELYVKFARKASSLGGTISAEHGIGKLKHRYLEIMYGKDAMMEMMRLKKAFDPNCILGLDNIFPRELLWKE